MLKTIREAYSTLNRDEQRQFRWLLLLVTMRGMVDAIGVASIMPFLSIAANPEIIRANRTLASIYQRFEFNSASGFLIFSGAAVFTILVFTLLFSAYVQRKIYRFNQQCNFGLSTRLLKTFLFKPYAWFLNQHSADLGKTILAEAEQFVSMVLASIINLISRVVTVVMLLGLLIAVNPIVALLTGFFLGGMYFGFFMLVKGKLTRLGEEMYDANERRFRLAQEAMGGIKDVKLNGLEPAYLERYLAYAHQYADRQAQHAIISELPKFFLEAIAFGGMLAVVLVLLIADGGGLATALPLIAVYAFAGYRLLPALQQIYYTNATLRFAGRVQQRLYFELSTTVDEPPRHSARQPRIPAFQPLRSIVLRNVSFRYPLAQSDTLRDLSLAIQANTTVGFVGKTGSGKTTILDLVLGLLSPSSGSLEINDTVVTGERLGSWQSMIGYVPQTIFLIDDSIAANIAFGIPSHQISMPDVERAARAADIHEFVVSELPKAYQTAVGERGVRLSGGQRQRIGIARALYHNPDVLVLDEATSALDNQTEAAVMDAVRNLGHQKTIIIVAHRLSTVRECDVIFYLEKGRIVDKGSFHELSMRHAYFAERS